MKAEFCNKYYTQSRDDGCAYETAFDTWNIKIAVWCSPGHSTLACVHTSEWIGRVRLRQHSNRCVCRVSSRHLVCASASSVTSMVCVWGLTIRTFVSTTFLSARAVEISVRRWLSLVGCCVGSGATQSMRPFLDAGGRAGAIGAIERNSM